MKLLEALRQVDRSENNSFDPNYEEFCRSLDIYDSGWNEEFYNEFRGYHLIKWYCTDAWVGVGVYYLRNELVAISTQKGRRSDLHIQYLDKAAGNLLRDYILSLMKKEEPEISILPPDELYGEIDPTYTVNFTGQLLTDIGYVLGRECKVINKFRSDIIAKKVEVEFIDNGEKEVVSIDKFEIPLQLQK